ncbi:MAG: hypothetical protein ACYCSO_05330 [Cuniculiplasma sp.]
MNYQELRDLVGKDVKILCIRGESNKSRGNRGVTGCVIRVSLNVVVETERGAIYKFRPDRIQRIEVVR